MLFPSYALATVLASNAPTTAEPKPAEDSTVEPAPERLLLPASLVIDVSALLKDQEADAAQRTAERVDEDLRKHLLAEYRTDLNATGPEAATVTIRFAFIDYMGSKYSVSIEVERPDGKNPPPIEYTCEKCLDEELIDGAIEHAEAIVALLQFEPEDTTDSGNHDNHPVERPRRGVLVGGYVGVGLGAALLGGGIAAIVVKPRQIEAVPSLNRNYRPLGIGLAVGGAAALATGVVLLATEYTRCKRRGTCEASDSSSATAVAPWVGPEAAGISLHHRF